MPNNTELDEADDDLAGSSELSWLDSREHLRSTGGTGPLLAAPVAGFLTGWPAAGQVSVAEIDPELADTAAFCERYRIPPEASANCVVVAGKRAGEVRFAACMVLATDRADVNGAVRRALDVRKASFAPMADAVERPEWSTAGSRRSGCRRNGRSSWRARLRRRAGGHRQRAAALEAADWTARCWPNCRARELVAELAQR